MALVGVWVRAGDTLKRTWWSWVCEQCGRQISTGTRGTAYTICRECARKLGWRGEAEHEC